MKKNLYRLLLLPLLLAAWGARAQAPAWLSATSVPANTVGQQVQAVATNAAGDVFVTGAYEGSATFGSTTLNSSGGSQDMYVAKWSNSTNSWAWAVGGGGSDIDQGLGIAVSGTNVYVTGSFTAGTGASISGSSLSGAGGSDIFVAKYVDGGTSVSNGGAVSGGGNSGDQGRAIAVNGTNVYVTGYIGTGSALVSGSALTSAGSQDVILAKYTDNGTLQSSVAARAGGSSAERGTGVAVNGTSIYITGYYNSTSITFGALPALNNASPGNGSDLFVAKYNDGGTLLTAASALSNGGANGDRATGIAANGSNLYVSGYFSSPTLVIGSATLTNADNTGNSDDAFVAKYTDGGSLTATTAVRNGGSSGDQALAIAANGTTIHATGTYGGTVAFGSSSLTSTGGTDVFVAKYTDAGSSLTVEGAVSGGNSSGDDFGFGIAASGTQAVAGGSLFSVPATFGGTTLTTGNGGFIARAGQASVTVTAVTGITPSPTATATVSYTVSFSGSVSGLTVSNFNLTTSGLTGASVSSVSGSGSTYTVVVNTGSGDGTLRLNVNNSSGVTPSLSNVPYTSGTTYTITKSFAAAPTLRIQGAGSASGLSDVTAFVDQVQVLSGGSAFANGLQNTSFETNNVAANNFLYQQQGVIAAPWTFTAQAGVARNNSGFGSTAADGDAVALLQSAAGLNGSVAQNLAVPTGTSYQVRFQTAQRTNNGPSDQVVNVFVNNVFVGNVQPNGIGTYQAFTSATFSVTAPALTATVSTTSASPTSTAPVPFAVSFSQSVGSSFTAADVTVAGGSLTSGSFSGSGSGPYTFTVTPSGSGTVSVSLVAGVAQDANNSGNSASNTVSVQYNQPQTAAPVVVTPANGSVTNNSLPTYTGTAPGTSTVTVIVDGTSIGTTTTSAAGNWTFTPSTPLAQGSHTVRATAQLSGQAVSANSNTNTFTVDTTPPAAPVVVTPANGSLTNNSTPTYTGTAEANSTVTVIVDGSSIGTTTANASGNWSRSQPTALSQGSHTVRTTVTDLAGNTSPNSNTNTFVVDTTPPAAPVVVTPANGSLTNNSTPTYTGTAEANSTVTVIVDGSAIGTTTANASGNWTRTQPVALSQGSHQVRATATDLAGNTSVNSNTNTFTVDTTAPTVVISSSAGSNGSTTATTPVPFTVTFSESVAGFAQGGLSVSGGNVSGFSGSGSTYTFSVTPTGSGTTVTVNVPANVAQDAAGNGNTAATQFSITYQQPLVATAQNVTVNLNANGTATLNASSVNNGSTGSGTLTYTIQKIAYGLVAETQTLTLATPNGANFQAIRFASYGRPNDNGNGNYTLNNNCNAANSVATATNSFVGRSSGSMDAQNVGSGNNNPQLGDPCPGTPKFLAVQAGYSADAASLTYDCSEAGKTQYVLLTVSNGSTSSTSVAQVTVNPAPTATISNVTPNSALPNATVTVTGTNLSGIGSTVTVNGASASVSNLTSTGFTFVVPAGATAGTGNLTVTAPCAQTLTSTFTVQQQQTAAPVVVTPANGSLTNNDRPTYSGTAPVSSTVTVIVDGTSIGTTTADASGNWSFTPVTPLTDGQHTVAATAQLSGQSVSANSNTNTFTVDASRPTVAISSTAGASGSTTGTSPIPFTVTFSESVTGFVTGDLTVTNGTVSNLSGSGTTYTFNVTPTTAGTATTVFVPGNVAQDAASNGNTAAPSVYSLTFTAPTITVTPASLPNGTQGTAYSVNFTAAGGSGTYAYIFSGTPVPGLSFSGSTLSGTPTASGTYNFRITATDNSAAPGPYSGFRDYSLTINVPNAAVWSGNTDTNWFTAGNWSTGVIPNSTTDATIPTAPSGGRFPVLTAGAANARNLTLNSGSTLTMSGGTLAIAANLTNNGTFTATGGTVGLGATIASNILGSGNTSFWNLTVGSNGVQQSTSATTSVQRLLTLNGTYTTNGNPFTLRSTAALTAMVINNGSNVVNGTVTVQRYIAPDLNPNLGYRHVSAPISTATIGSLTTGSFSPVVNPAYNTSATPNLTTPFPTVYGYDQSRLATTSNNLPTFDKGWFSPAALSDPMGVGQGYTALIGGGQTWNFTGGLNNGDVSLNLARNSGATAAASGLHLIGNPYPSPLDWSTVPAANRPGVDPIVYVFESNDPTNPYSGSYRFFANGIGTISPVLPIGQGFFVRVTAGQTAGTLTLRNTNRPTTYQATTYRRGTADTRPQVQLSLKAAGAATGDDAFVYFEQGATDAFEPQFDAEKLQNPSGLNLSTSLSATQRLSIDGRAPLGTAQLVVPLAVGVPRVGSYTLGAAELLNLTGTPTYLRDLQTGAIIDLAVQPSYQFTVSNASALITGRFELVFSPQRPLATAPAALAQQVGLYPNPASAKAFVELPASLGRQAVQATLVDAVGREVRTLTLPAQGAVAHTLDLRELPAGVYLLRLSTSAGSIVKKLTVE